MYTVLLVEDNSSIIMGLEYLLKENDYNVLVAQSKLQAENIINSDTKIDIVLLDIMLPDGDGFSLCRYIKEKDKAPVIFLTAKDEEKDVVMGFDLGADDYIIKPFRNMELLSRIKNILRRNGNANEITFGEFKMDMDGRRLYKNSQEIKLTKLEFEILKILFSNPKKVFTREEILSYIWDSAGNFVNDNTLTVTIKRLRSKIDDKDGNIIQTVRGVGYKL